MKTIKGFSLIELLVVIGIIGVLLTFAVVSYDSMQKKARDTRRKDDIKKLQAAFEQYYALCGATYPTIGANGVPSEVGCPTVTILPVAPQDPRGTPYPCATPATCDGTRYIIKPAYETNESFSVNNQQ